MNEQLTKQNKIEILESAQLQLNLDHPEFQEEHTTGWDLIQGIEMWLKELKGTNNDSK